MKLIHLIHFCLILIALSACSSRESGFPTIGDRGFDPIDEQPVQADLECGQWDIGTSAFGYFDNGDAAIDASIRVREGLNFVEVQVVSVSGATAESTLPTPLSAYPRAVLSTDETGIVDLTFQLRDNSFPQRTISCSTTVDMSVRASQGDPSVTMLTENMLSAEEVRQGESLYIGWTSENVQTCSVYKDGVLAQSTSGTDLIGSGGIFSTGPLLNEGVVLYTVECDHSLGKVTANVALSVLPGLEAELLVNGSVNPFPLPYPSAAPVFLSWQSEGASSCNIFANGQILAQVAPSGESPPLAVNVPTIFALECFGSNQNSIVREVAQFVGPPLNAQAQITADEPYVNSGDRTKLDWSSENATSCELRKSDPDGNGSSVVSRARNASNFSTGRLLMPTLFTLECQSQAGTVSDSVLISVAVEATIQENMMPQNTSPRWPGLRDGRIHTHALMTGLVPGLKLSWSDMQGHAILRVYHGRATIIESCASKIAIQFKDSSGNVIQSVGDQYGLVYFHQFQNGITIPPGATSVWGSLPDSAYFDNPPNRHTSSWTGGCRFKLIQSE